MSTIYQNRSISKGIDWLTVWLYAFILFVGIICIFMVEYNSDQPGLTSQASWCGTHLCCSARC